MIKHSPTAFWHSLRVVLFCFQRCNTETLAGQNVSCSSLKGTPAERGHHEAILAFMSMIDDTGMEAAFEKSPLLREKWWLFGFFFPDSIPLCFSVGHFHNALYSRTQLLMLVLYTSSHNNSQNQVQLSVNSIRNIMMFVGCFFLKENSKTDRKLHQNTVILFRISHPDLAPYAWLTGRSQ